MSKSVNVNFGSLLIPLLTALFVWLKLTDQIDWSWVWVLSPIWIGAIVGTVIVTVILLVVAKLGDR